MAKRSLINIWLYGNKSAVMSAGRKFKLKVKPDNKNNGGLVYFLTLKKNRV
jgi:hypothetical protein